jgi:hypothetical protein
VFVVAYETLGDQFMPNFRMPKQTDRALIEALFAIRNDLAGFKVPLQVRIRTPDPGPMDIDVPDNFESHPIISAVLSENSHILPHLYLRNQNHTVLHVQRLSDQITDQISVAGEQNWFNSLPGVQDAKVAFVIKLSSVVQRHLRVLDAEAALTGGTEKEWTRYRDSQTAILNSLQETQRTILRDFARQSLELERTSKAKLVESENELQSRYQHLESELNRKYEARVVDLDTRESTLDEREKNFNTKEARYVARSEQQKQIDQIKGWLEGWSLTKGTRSKRYFVMCAYAAGICATGFFAYWYGRQSMQIIASSNGNLAWWQWGLLSIKSIFPLAAFITFVVYFIRWSSEWARQHADEEFRNRARVLDIGRTAWLLEAVRDAQDNGKEVPSELLKELSRNLFVYSGGTEIGDLHPQAVTDLIMQGLNSLRVKTADGTEVEAKRGKG